MAVTEFMDFLLHLVFAQSLGVSSGQGHLVPLQHVFGADGAPYILKGWSSVGAVASCSMVNITCWLHPNVVMKVEKARKEDFQPLISHSSVFCLLVSSFVRIKRVQICAVSVSLHEMATDNGKRTEKCNV